MGSEPEGTSKVMIVVRVEKVVMTLNRSNPMLKWITKFSTRLALYKAKSKLEKKEKMSLPVISKV